MRLCLIAQFDLFTTASDGSPRRRPAHAAPSKQAAKCSQQLGNEAVVTHGHDE
jgi:hypothetical protein